MFWPEGQVISLRVIVNMDTFLKGESPEQLWLGDSSFSSSAQEGTGETVDIFEPAMHNLFDVSSIIINNILEGDIQAQ